jgi:hypothetical protein
VQQAEFMKQLAQATYQYDVALYAQEAAQFAISQEEKYQLMPAALSRETAAEIAAINQQLSIEGQSVATLLQI